MKHLKVILKEFGLGLLIIFFITILEFLVSMPLGNPWDYYEPQNIAPYVYQQFINKELLLTALPTAIVIFIF